MGVSVRVGSRFVSVVDLGATVRAQSTHLACPAPRLVPPWHAHVGTRADVPPSHRRVPTLPSAKEAPTMLTIALGLTLSLALFAAAITGGFSSWR
jgi:hypothetical protein